MVGRVLPMNNQLNAVREKGDSEVKKNNLWSSNLNREIHRGVEVTHEIQEKKNERHSNYEENSRIEEYIDTLKQKLNMSIARE